MKPILIFLLLITAFNTGLIWMVQLVHYPGFLRIGPENYELYQNFHMRSITWIVAPSMGAELLLSGVALLFWKQLPSQAGYVVGLALLGIIWVNTALWAVPAHGKLLEGFDQKTIERLVSINWWRTTAWSLRSGIMAYLLYRA